MFGRFIPQQKIYEILDPLTEWESFQLLLPRAIHRLFFTPVVSEVDALQALQKTIRNALRDAPDFVGEKRGVRNSPTNPT